MDSYTNYIEKEISFRGAQRKIRIADVTHESQIPTHKPSVPIYSVEFNDKALTDVMGEDRLQIILTDPPNFNDAKSMSLLANDDQRAIMKEINKAVIEHYQVFHAEEI